MVHGLLILIMFTPFAHISLALRGVRPAWSFFQYYQLLKNNHFSPGSKQPTAKAATLNGGFD
jgi:hypothetical protein